MVKLSKDANLNYTAKVVKLKDLNKLPNSDFLQVTNVDFQQVITGLDAKEGDIYVYFPVECAINEDFLSSSNYFRNKDLNKDKEKSGFFEKNCRVRAMKLRGSVSNGFIEPLSNVLNWAYSGNVPKIDLDELVGNEFDLINDKVICKKYIPKGVQKKANNNQKKKVKNSKLIEGQFNFHIKTNNLRRNIDNISPQDLISVTYKTHGTSAIASNILVKKKMSLFDRIGKFLGFNIVDKEYGFIYSSRKVIKNDDLDKEHNHFYDENIWGDACKKYDLENIIPKGFSVYFEILGYTSDGAYIQKDYDYGCNKGDFKIEVYRVTFTNVNGIVTELTYPQMAEFCERLNLPIVHLFYYGYAKNMYEDLDYIYEPEKWNEKFITRLERDYNDKDCFKCRNKVPEEGIVIRKELLNECESYKLKSFRFLEKETKENDKGLINIEDNN